MSLSTMAGGG